MKIEKEYVEGLLRKIERLQAERDNYLSELQKANQIIIELQTARLRQGGTE